MMPHVSVHAATCREAARKGFYDVLIVDTAGRLGIDDKMMAEISGLNDALKPAETLFVVDAMTGQDAANTAKAFGDALPLTGVVLTKVDGDARGGAALSVRQITGKPIKFLGVGEKLEALEPFHPDRVAQRILGMGDVMSLIEKTQNVYDEKQAKKMARKMKKASGSSQHGLTKSSTIYGPAPWSLKWPQESVWLHDQKRLSHSNVKAG